MKHILSLFLLMMAVWSCSEEPVETVFFNFGTENGIFIANEGNFMYGNGSLSFYQPENKTVTNQLFYARNNAPLGDVVQSLALFQNTLFIVVNNSGKIYVTDAGTVEFKGAVTGLTSPRYIHLLSKEKAYVSDLHSNQLTIFNPETFKVTGRIELGNHTSEQFVQVGKYVFVSSWVLDESVLVIDSETDKLVAEIQVPFQPKDLVVDKNDKIWVLSTGDTEGSSTQLPALSRIDPTTFTLEQTFRFESGSLASGLKINSSGDTLLFINYGIYKMPVSSRKLPESAFIQSENRLFYSLAVDPKNDEIYISDAIDYTQDAVIYRYSSGGFLIDSFKTGINPSDFLFR